MIDGVLGIDVSKNTLDASMSSCNKVRARSFANSPDGWRHLLDWLITQRVRRVHTCLESTGRYSLGIAGPLNEAGYVVRDGGPPTLSWHSILVRNPAAAGHRAPAIDSGEVRSDRRYPCRLQALRDREWQKP